MFLAATVHFPTKMHQGKLWETMANSKVNLLSRGNCDGPPGRQKVFPQKNRWVKAKIVSSPGLGYFVLSQNELQNWSLDKSLTKVAMSQHQAKTLGGTIA